MIFLDSIKIRPTSSKDYPTNLQIVKNLKELKFTTPITYFIGDNGSGKSTILESIALAIHATSIGSEQLHFDPTLKKIKKFSENVLPSWKHKTHNGFFLRAEDVFGFTRSVEKLKKEADELAAKYEGDDYGSKLARGSILGQKKSLEERYGADLDANSHGQTFMKLFRSRFVPNGLYLIDEPEAPLSFSKQLEFIAQLNEMVRQDCQFIIATHSPILTAMENSTIYIFDQKIRSVKYSDIEQFNLLKDFLNKPERFLKYL